MSKLIFEIEYSDGAKVLCEGASQAACMLGVSVQRIYYAVRERGGRLNARTTVRIAGTAPKTRVKECGDRSKLNTVPNMVDIVMRQMSGDISAPRKAWGEMTVFIKEPTNRM